MRVLLVTTGVCEQRGLPASLKRHFPGVEFDAIRRDGFTSCALPAVPAPGPDSEARKLAAELIAAIEPGQRADRRYDLAVVVEDLELYYAEADALCRAGAVRPCKVNPSVRDLEDFLVADAVFADRERFPDQSASQWATVDRERHPKHYLRFLCQADPLDPLRRSYREGKGGADALGVLSWPAVLSRAARTRLARALLDDLAEGLDRPRETGEVHPATALKLGLPGAVLRNI